MLALNFASLTRRSPPSPPSLPGTLRPPPLAVQAGVTHLLDLFSPTATATARGGSKKRWQHKKGGGGFQAPSGNPRPTGPWFCFSPGATSYGAPGFQQADSQGSGDWRPWSSGPTPVGPRCLRPRSGAHLGSSGTGLCLEPDGAVERRLGR